MKHVRLFRFLALSVSLFGLSSPGAASSPALDTAFVSTIGSGLTPDSYPTFDGGTGATNVIVLQADGKIVAGGNVSKYNKTGNLTALKRLNSDGSLDSTFNSGGAGLASTTGQPEVNSMLVVSGDKIYVGGTFNTYNGTTRNGLLRLNADGSLDTTFNNTGLLSLAFGVRYAQALAVQPDGKLLVAGAFLAVSGGGYPNLARVNADGTPDASFNAAIAGTMSAVTDIDVLPDGRLLICGSRYNSTLQRNDPIVYRLNNDGSTDPSFNIIWGDNYGAINEIQPLPDGRVVVGGDFALLGSTTIRNIACFDANGAPDTTFNTNIGTGPNGWAGGELKLLPDGTILSGGIFTSWNGQPRASVARLNSDGTLDPTFNPAPYLATTALGYLTHLYTFAVQDDGKILLGGWMGRFTDNAVETYSLTRVMGDYGTGPGTVRLTAPTITTTELAGSVTVPVSRFGGLIGAVSVNYSITPLNAVPGTDYTAVSGTLTWNSNQGGVQNITVPILQDTAQDGLKAFNVTLAGLTGGAVLGTSTTLVGIRDDDAPPVIVLEPVAVSLDQGANFSLVVFYDSVLPATVQWQRDTGSGFTNVPGATSLVYTVSGADPALNGGTYRAIVTNANGSDTSLAVAVTVKVPAGSVITSFVPPADTLSATFSALDSSGRFLIGNNTGLRRLKADGTLDPTTTFGISVSGLTSILPLADGRTLLGGNLGTLTHLPSNTTSTVGTRLVRLNADGTIDASYTPSLNGVVTTLAAGASGKFYAGVFAASSVGLQRFTSTGASDGTFSVPSITVGSGTAGYVWFVKEQSDGKVLVAHTNGASGSPTYRLTRLNANGSLDTSFGTGGHVILPTYLTGFDILPDGRIVIAARFNNAVFPGSQYLALLKADGAQDTSFQFGTGILNNNPLGVTYRDGRLLVWGNFTTVNGNALGGLIRLNLDGTLDPTFAVGSGANNTVASALYTASGDLFIAGSFTSYKSTARKYAALLVGGPGALGVSPAAVSVLEGAGTATVTVKRFGTATSPVSVSYATVAETATAGSDFTATSGTLSWAANDTADKTVSITLANNATGEPNETFRLRLSAPTPDTAATLALADAVVTIVDDDNLPSITTHPVTQLVAQGANVTFTVVATSVPAATYRWTFNDTDLADGSGVSGSGTATLTLTAVGPTRVGTYRVRVTNTNGPVTSDPASLDIALNPAFTDAAWPLNLTINSTVNAIVPLPDGGAYVAGQFTNFNGQTGRSYLVKISSTGVVDTAFSPAPNAAVTSLVLDGNRLYAFSSLGTLTQIGGGAALNNFAALDATTGLRLGTFMTALGTGANGTVRALAVLSDGDLLLGGDFTSYNANTSHHFLARINSDGSLHSPFNTATVTGSSNVVTALGAGPNGTFVAGGNLVYGTNSRMVRFNADGSLDATFATTGATFSTSFTRIRVLDDGRVMASGSALPPSNRVITRLSATGAWDSAEYFGQTSGTFYDFVLQSNGRSVGVGSFTFVGTPVNFSNLASFSTVGALEQTWVGGTGFDNTAQTVALAENGRLWIGGDFTTFNAAATQRLIRLNGYAIPLAVTLQPKAVETNPATTATFTARATGTSALTYRWLRNGVDLTDGGNISGATTATLTIANATDAAEDVYSVRVSNLSGTTVSNGATLVVLGSPEILTQPAASLVSYTGRPFSLAVTARGIAPLTYQWRKGGNPVSDGSGITGAATAKLTFASLALADSGEYDVMVTGTAATPSGKFTLTVLPNPVERVATFSSLVTSTSQPVYTILPLADGGALIGGRFNALNGASSSTTTARIARVLPDGTVASVPFTTNGDVRDIVRLPGGKFLVAGEFSLVTPTGGSTLTRSRIIRLNADFSLDTSFDPGVTAPASSYVYSLALDSLGRIYAAGDFASWNGNAAHSRLVRLRADGSHDTSFVGTFNNFVRKVVVTADGKVYAGGSFTSYQGRSYFVRLSETGALDATFAPSLSNTITNFIAQPDGKLLAISGTTLSRFLDTGATDTSFPTLTATGLNDVTLQPDGRLIISGSFTTLGGVTRYGLMRLSSEGVNDPTFDVTGQTTGLAFAKVDGYGRVWLGGTISVYNGVFATNALVVVNGDQVALGVVQGPDPVSASGGQNAVFKVTATGTSALSYQWLRNGSPLSTDAHFSGTNTATLTVLGVQPGDEALYSVTVTNSSGNVTSSAAEFIYLEAPEILTAPVAVTAEVGQSAIFFVAARGAGTLTYEWLKGTTVLANSATISGATTAQLSLPSLVLTDGGSYKVRITNAFGSTSSSAVVLTVVRSPSSLASGLVIPTFNSTVNTVLPLAGGGFLAGGAFGTITYPGGSASRSYFAKIKADGSPDTTWPVVNAAVTCIAQDSTGRIYLGGTFTTVTPAGAGAITRNRLLRLSSTGVLDTTFDPLVGPNNTVLGIRFDAAGRLYVHGNFTSYRAETTSGYIVRLNADGSRDATFVSSAFASIPDIDFASGSRLWLSHANSWGGQSRIVLVDEFGVKDAAFTYPGTMTSTGLETLPDGSVLSFSNNSPFLQKIAATGAITSPFPVGGGPNAAILKHAASGSQFYLQGSFTTYGGVTATSLVRINADGTRDAAFDAGAGFNGTVESMVADTQGRLWAVGSFVSYKGDTNLAKIVVLNGGATETNSGPVADPLDTYLETAGVPANQRGPNDDPDHDGLPNLLEYALGFAPNTITLTGLPGATVSVGNLTLSYKRAAADITYTVEANPSLANPAGWTSAGVTQGTPDGNGNTTATVPATGANQFLRLRITRPAP